MTDLKKTNDDNKKRFKECTVLFENLIKQILSCSDLKYAIDENDVTLKTGKRQYSHIVFWIEIKLKETKTLANGDVTAIHITPYCITRNDVFNAFLSNPQNPLNKQICKDGVEDKWIDLDWTTFNFHKYVNPSRMRFQVVLVKDNDGKKYGPRKKIPRGKSRGISKKVFFSLDPKDKRLDSIKTNWYFPSLKYNLKNDDYYELKVKNCEKFDWMDCFSLLSEDYNSDGLEKVSNWLINDMKDALEFLNSNNETME